MSLAQTIKGQYQSLWGKGLDYKKEKGKAHWEVKVKRKAPTRVWMLAVEETKKKDPKMA